MRGGPLAGWKRCGGLRRARNRRRRNEGWPAGGRESWGVTSSVSQPLIAGVIADLAMSPPDGIGQTVGLPMSGEAPFFSHKAKRRAAFQPGKPLRRIRFKAEPSLLGTDHDVVPIAAIFHQGQH